MDLMTTTRWDRRCSAESDSASGSRYGNSGALAVAAATRRAGDLAKMSDARRLATLVAFATAATERGQDDALEHFDRLGRYWTNRGLKGFLAPYRRLRDAERTAGCGPHVRWCGGRRRGEPGAYPIRSPLDADGRPELRRLLMRPPQTGLWHVWV
jgi:hypothetical protein